MFDFDTPPNIATVEREAFPSAKLSITKLLIASTWFKFRFKGKKTSRKELLLVSAVAKVAFT